MEDATGNIEFLAAEMSFRRMLRKRAEAFKRAPNRDNRELFKAVLEGNPFARIKMKCFYRVKRWERDGRRII